MRTTLIACCALLPLNALGASAPRTPETVWTGALEAGRAKIVSEAPKFTQVRMSIDRSSVFDAVISEPALGVNVDVSRSGPDFWINGYLKASGRSLDRRSSLNGVSIMGGGVNVEARPFGPQSYLLNGPYKDAQGKDGSLSLRIDVLGAPVRDLQIREKGLDLYFRWRGTGYEATGKADPALYGKRELAIIGAAVATVTWDVFGR